MLTFCNRLALYSNDNLILITITIIQIAILHIINNNDSTNRLMIEQNSVVQIFRTESISTPSNVTYKEITVAPAFNYELTIVIITNKFVNKCLL